MLDPSPQAADQATDPAAKTEWTRWKPRFFAIWTGQALPIIDSA